MKRKVIIFVQDGVGGAERMSVLIGKNLDPNIFDIFFCLIERSRRTSISDFIPKGMRIMRLANKNSLLLAFDMVRTIIKEKPYVVFSSVFNLTNKFLPFRWLFPKTKVIIRCDNYLYTYSERQQKMITKLYPKANYIIAQTDEMKDELVTHLKISADKVITLQNPVDKQTIDMKVTSSASPYDENGKKYFVAVGRFNRQKGFDILIDAFVKVQNVNPNTDLYIVGDYAFNNGEIHKDILRKAKAQGIEEKIHCVGYKDNPYVYIKSADCFVLSSRWEGLPNVLLESLYLGTPVAAFKCIPVIERIVEEGMNGYLAEKEDANSLANAMVKALSLGRINSYYKSAEIKDFEKLFL